MEDTKRTILVTGSNRGLGYELVKALYASSTSRKIIMTSRNIANAQKSLQKLREMYPKSPSELYAEELDLENESSFDTFIESIRNKFQKIDILVNNAGTGHRSDVMAISSSKTVSSDLVTKILTTNFFNTIKFTEKMLPLISRDGKIIMVSSELGQLNFQGPEIQEKLSSPSITTQQLIDLAKLFMESALTSTHTKYGFSSSSYFLSKALLNSYVRYCLGRLTDPNQQVYTMNPGWCRTDMGGPEAPLTPEEGIDTIVYLIELPYKVNKEYQCNFFSKRDFLKFQNSIIRGVKIMSEESVCDIDKDHIFDNKFGNPFDYLGY